MNTFCSPSRFYHLNGRGAGVLSTLAKEKLVRATTSNYWSSSEYNSNNALNVNWNNGNVNNNNKYNSNLTVRPVAALDDKEREGWIDAFDDCIANKMTSPDALWYRAGMEADIMRLGAEVKGRTYKPSTSIAFIVTKPKLREIFAANFRDRIVQHWIIQRINPLVEARFEQQGNVSYNCRKHYGTLAAVTRLANDIADITDDYAREAWVGKFDVKSFFMSIDIDVLWSLLEPFVREKYHGSDIEDLLWVTKVTIYHRPQNDCRKRGTDNWSKLDPSKSLFGKTDNTGMPIGNITSQILANFYMSYFDEVMIRYCERYGGRYIRFVDDFVVVMPCKEYVVSARYIAENYLRDHLHLKMHADKVYIQPARHGMKFVGSVVMPHRIYTINRTYGGLASALRKAEHVARAVTDEGGMENLLALQGCQSSLNSYLGMVCHGKYYLKVADIVRPYSYIWRVMSFDYETHKFSIRKEYKINEHHQSKNRTQARRQRRVH